MFQYASKPQPIGKVLDNGIRLCLSTFKSVVGIAFVGAIISNLPNLYSPAQQAGQALQAEQMSQFMGVALITMVASLVFYNAVVFRINAIASSKETGLATSLSIGLKKLLPVLIGLILYIVAVIIGSVLLIIPGMILMMSLLFYSMLIVVDDSSIFASLKSSHRLVWGNWWRTTTVLMVPAILMMVIYFAIGLVAGETAGVAGEVGQAATGMPVTITAVSVVVGTIGGPLFYAIMLVQMHDLKLRKQGLDLEQRIEAG